MQCKHITHQQALLTTLGTFFYLLMVDVSRPVYFQKPPIFIQGIFKYVDLAWVQDIILLQSLPAI